MSQIPVCSKTGRDCLWTCYVVDAIFILKTINPEHYFVHHFDYEHVWICHERQLVCYWPHSFFIVRINLSIAGTYSFLPVMLRVISILEKNFYMFELPIAMYISNIETTSVVYLKYLFYWCGNSCHIFIFISSKFTRNDTVTKKVISLMYICPLLESHLHVTPASLLVDPPSQ